MSTEPIINAPASTDHTSDVSYAVARRNARAPVAITLQISAELPGHKEPVSFRGETRVVSSAGATIVLADCPQEVFESLSKDQTLQLLPVCTGPLQGVVNGLWVEPSKNPATESPRLCLSLTLQDATWFPPA